MSVDFPSSQPTNIVSAASADKMVDVQTLRESFAAALRSYTTASSGLQTDAMLEALQTIQENNADLRKQERQEYQQQSGHNAADQLDKKLLNKSDVRQDVLSTDYQNQKDRQERLQNDYLEKVEKHTNFTRAEIGNPPASSIQHTQNQVTGSHSAIIQGMQDSANTVPLQHNVVSQNAAPQIAMSSTNTQQNVPAQEASIAAIPSPSSGLTGTPSSFAPVPPSQVSPTNAFTIFTASKRFGQNQGKQDEKEDEDEAEVSVDNIPVKKPQPFAAFESTKIADRRQQTITEWEPASRLSRKTATMPYNPKDIETNQLTSVKSLDEFFNTSPSSIVPQKDASNQQLEQAPYFHRIAAACEAAAQYAPIRIKVHLGSLGTMLLRFYHQSEKLHLQFETATKESAEFLHEHLEGLKLILAKRNVHLESVDVLLVEKE